MAPWALGLLDTSRAWSPLSSPCPGPIGHTEQGMQQETVNGRTGLGGEQAWQRNCSSSRNQQRSGPGNRYWRLTPSPACELAEAPLHQPAGWCRCCGLMQEPWHRSALRGSPQPCWLNTRTTFSPRRRRVALLPSAFSAAELEATGYSPPTPEQRGWKVASAQHL